MRVFGCAVAAVCALAAAGVADAADLTLKPLSGQSRLLSGAELRAMAHVRTGADYEGVRIEDILPLLGSPRGEPIRGEALAKVMIFRAADGYTVVLPLAQVDGDFSTGAPVVVDTRAGQPLDETEGPFRLVVEGDKRPARSLRNLASIELRTLK